MHSVTDRQTDRQVYNSVTVRSANKASSDDGTTQKMIMQINCRHA